MTMRNKTLTAVAALSLAFAGPALAQDNGFAPGVTAPAGSSYGNFQAAPLATDSGDATQDAGTPDAGAADAASSDEVPAEAAEPVTQDAAAEAEAETGDAAIEEEAPSETDPAVEQPAAEDQATDEAEAGAEPAEEAEATEEDIPAEATETEPAATTESDEEVTPVEEASVEAESDAPVEAAVEEAAVQHIGDISFSFEGPFGTYDQFQLQRGLQVYTEICAACHGLQYVPIRTLADPNGVGLPADQVRAYAEELMPIYDPEIDDERPRLPTDHFPTVSGMGMGPDLSLMAKARAGFHGPYGTGISQLFRGIGGPEYIHALLVGYDDEMKEEAGAVLYHNTAFPGNWIQMPLPLMDDMIEYEDGTPATVDQMARDVSAFLMWAAEPKMMDRKQVGLVSVLFLVLLTALLYLTNKRIWRPIKHRNDQN